MIVVNLRIPNELHGLLHGLYRATWLRMPDMGEPVTIYYKGVKIGKGKVIAVDARKRIYDVEIEEKDE
jgi:hypothetical protein